jgi:hypothetical protein
MASHIMGGEITWQCAGTNQYQFQLVIYRDCNGQDILATDLDIEVWGHPTVTSINCSLIQTIDLSPSCTEIPGSAIQLECGVGSSGGNGAGAIQKFIFQSAPITLNGTPPATGWSFTYDDWSRSWSLTNIDTPQNYGITLSATMYQNTNNVANQCVDSSPQFAQDPYMLLCAGTSFEFNSNVFDPDNDSLVFSWGVPLDHFPAGTYDPPANPIPVPFVNGFSATNPTPDASFNGANVSADINANTGTISFLSNTTGDYAMKQKIDSYRNGELISTVNREIQLVIINCSGNNTAPQITPPFAGNTTFEAEFFAGDLVNFDILISDNELLQDGSPQTVTLEATGNYFGTNFTDPNSGCDILPCATLDQTPLIIGVQGVATNFNWQTDCDHLADANGVQQQEQTYSFVLKAKDDFCSVPGLTYKTIRIKLKNSQDLPPADMNCVNVLPNGDTELSWTKTSTTTGTFSGYEVYSLQNGLLTTINDINTENYTHVGANANLNSKDYYVLTKFGCNGNNAVSSDTLKSIFLDLNDLGDGRVSLTWNSTSDPINNGDNSLQNIVREFPVGTWTLRDKVPFGTNFYQDTIDVCDEWLNYRIEIPNAAGCISGSNIDGDQLQDVINPYIPIVTSVSLDTTTNAMEIIWNQNSSQDTYGYIIYQNIGGFWEPIDTVYGINNTSYQNINSVLYNEAQVYGIAAFDSCLTNSVPATYHTSALSEPHTSVYLENEFDVCAKNVTLNWTQYEGFEVEKYEVIVKVENSSYEIIESLAAGATTFTHVGLMPDVTYYYYVRAVSITGVKAYSNQNERFILRPTPADYHYLTTSSHNLSSNIEIEFLTDPNAAVQGYEIHKKGPNDNEYSFLTLINQTTSNLYFYEDAEIDGNQGAYNYKINLIDSCGNLGQESNIATTIFLRVSTQDTEMKSTLAWSPYYGFDGNIVEYRVYRGINGVFEPEPIAILSSSIRGYVDDLSDYYDSEGEFCYRVEAVESVNSYARSEVSYSNTVCVTIEPIVYIPNAFTIDGYNPIFLPVISLYDFESYDLQIYNRWGEIVFNTDDRYLGWNGEGNDGDLKPEGVYVYLLRFKDEFGTEYEYKGSLTMLYSNRD